MDQLTKRLSRLTPAERWSLLMALAKRHHSEVSVEAARIEHARPREDIRIISWQVNGFERRDAA